MRDVVSPLQETISQNCRLLDKKHLLAGNFTLSTFPWPDVNRTGLLSTQSRNSPQGIPFAFDKSHGYKTYAVAQRGPVTRIKR